MQSCGEYKQCLHLGSLLPAPTSAPALADLPLDLAPLQDQTRQLIRLALKAGASDADAVVATGRSRSVSVRNGVVEETESSENDAFSLRVFVGQRVASVSANRGADLNKLAKRAVAMARVAPENEFAGLADPSQIAKQVQALDLVDTANPETTDLVDQAIACEASALSVKGVTQSSGAGASHSLGGTVLAASNGFTGAFSGSRHSLSVSVVAQGASGMERDYDYDSQRYLEDLRQPDDIGLAAGRRAAERVNPKILDSQVLPVVFSPRMARTIVGHMVAALNGASVARKTSFLRDAMGKTAFADAITLTDDPYVARGLGSRPFDGEGVAGEPLHLIENGVVKNWLLDTSSARQLGLVTNGRASRSGSSTSPSASNLILVAGDQSPQAIMEEFGRCLYVTELIGQGVDLVAGTYSRGASGFLMENGEALHPVSEITIAASLDDMFANLIIGDDLDMGHAISTPTLALEAMTIAGR